MKYIVLLVSLLFCFQAFSFTPPLNNKRSVKIVGLMGSTASGYIWKDNIVITNKHVCEMDPILIIRSTKGDHFALRKVSHDYKDICVIYSDKNYKLKRAKHSTKRVYEKVYYTGYPNGYKSRYYGKIFGEAVIYKTQHWMCSLRVWPGSSGSAVLNKSGQIIGIVSMMNTRSLDAIVIKMLEVKKFLKDLKAY